MGGRDDREAAGKVRLLVLLTDAYGGHGGIAAFNRALLEALCADPRVSEVVAVARIAGPFAEPLPAKLRFDISGAGGLGGFARSVVRAACSGRFDLVHCGHINLSPFAWLAATIARTRWTLSLHGIEAWRRHPRATVRLALRSVAQVHAVSRLTLDRFRAWHPVPEARCTIVPNTFPAGDFAPGPKDPALAARLGATDRKVLLTLGRLVSEERAKGFDQILELLPSLAARIPEIFYIIAGTGGDRDRLEAKARALAVADRVAFTGFVDEVGKADLYRLADAYVMPSSGEGFGIVFLEAMACGVPTVASATDGGREAVRDGAIGWAVDPADPAALEAAILEALAAPKAVPAGLAYFSEDRFRERMQAMFGGWAARARA